MVSSVVGGSEPVRVRIAWASREFFDVPGIRPVIGRSFVREELREGGSPAVLVSHGFWKGRLGARADLSSLRLEFEGRVHSVVGVMPPGFAFPPDTDVWVPRARAGSSKPNGPQLERRSQAASGRIRRAGAVGRERHRQESSSDSRREHLDDRCRGGSTP
jgi:hypothetical protein